MPHILRMKLLPAFILLCATLFARPALAQTTVPEAQLKAAFVFNFAKYVEWPDSPAGNGSLVACVIGGDSFAAALAQFDGRLLAGRSFQVLRQVTPEATGCHLLVMMGESARRALAQIRPASMPGVLTVSDLDGFVDEGGMIGLVRSEDRLQFDINQQALQRAGLRASSQLLKLARKLGGRAR